MGLVVPVRRGGRTVGQVVPVGQGGETMGQVVPVGQGGGTSGTNGTMRWDKWYQWDNEVGQVVPMG